MRSFEMNRREQVNQLLVERQSQLAVLRSSVVEGFTLRNAAGDSWAILLSDATNPGMFRYQTFRANGFYGHSTHETLESAVEDAFQCGYRFEDPGALDRLYQTETWRKGMQSLEIITRYNSGQITWDDLKQAMSEIE